MGQWVLQSISRFVVQPYSPFVLAIMFRHTQVQLHLRGRAGYIKATLGLGQHQKAHPGLHIPEFAHRVYWSVFGATKLFKTVQYALLDTNGCCPMVHRPCGVLEELSCHVSHSVHVRPRSIN